MPRSLYMRLNRLYGQRDTGLARFSRSQDRLAALESYQASFRSASLSGTTVVVVGAGFGGLSAAYQLAQFGASVTVLEAQTSVGGRVLSNPNFVSGLTIEFGAELIGLNHPVWLQYARQFDLGMSVLTDEDTYAAEGLQVQMYFNGVPIPPDQQVALATAMGAVFAKIEADAATIDAYNPWLSPSAKKWDGVTVDQQLIAYCGGNNQLLSLIRLDLENNQTVPTSQQSYLGLLATVKGGGLHKYWEDTEVLRCAGGNQAIATALAQAIASSPGCTVNSGEPAIGISVAGSVTTVTTTKDHYTPDYVVLAVPPTAWQLPSGTWPQWQPITLPFTLPAVHYGPGVKFFSHVSSRFWIADLEAPSAVSDIAAMNWEGSDNQISQVQPAELSVFAGGQYAVAIEQDPEQQNLQRALNTIFPGYQGSLVAGQLQDWPNVEYIGLGYSCPAPGDVCTVVEALNSLQTGNILFAGEHVSTCFFGYMEGALQSGVIAAQKVALLACGMGQPVGENYGTFPFNGAVELTSGVTGVPRLLQLVISSGDILDGITATYELTNLDGSVTGLTPGTYGGNAGESTKTFPISDGDYVKSVSVIWGTWFGKTVVGQIGLTTAFGQAGQYGALANFQQEGQTTFSAPDGAQIIGFLGSAVAVTLQTGLQTNVISSLGVVYGPQSTAITSITLSGGGETLAITVNGYGFPQATCNGERITAWPYVGTVDQFILHDVTQGNWSAGSTNPPDPGHPNLVTLNYLSWSSTQITIAGFGGQYGQYSYVVKAGDQLEATIYAGLGQPAPLASATATVPN